MKHIPTRLQPWFDVAGKCYKLSHVEVQMARELGMNPKKLGKPCQSSASEPWKLPLAAFIAECYRKRFGRSAPVQIKSLEQVVAGRSRPPENLRRLRKLEKAKTETSESNCQTTGDCDRLATVIDPSLEPGGEAF